MTPSRPVRLAPILVVAGCAVGLIAFYLGGYFVLGPRQPNNVFMLPNITNRYFKYQWLCSIYHPAGIAEAKQTGTTVYFYYRVHMDDGSIFYKDDSAHRP